MDLKTIKEFRDFDNFGIEVNISLERIIISKDVPSRIEIIEKAGFGDDRERRVTEWEKKIILDIKIPKDKQSEVSDIKESLERNVWLTSIQYFEFNDELILHNIKFLDWDDIC
jgi:hypothetical protein